MMIKELSILIPVYNTNVFKTVKRLHELCERVVMDTPDSFKYEIIVADDGSTKSSSVAANDNISTLPHCIYIKKEQNSGSAATRNLLAQKSQYEWVLYLDSDMELPGVDYIIKYLSYDQYDVVNGGIIVGGDKNALQNNLRYLYEKRAEPSHTAEERQKKQFYEFRSTNFLIRRRTILQHPFDERFKKSGYEDVCLGSILQKSGATILHINNPLVMNDFENNADYVAKIERSLQTLYYFRNELGDASNMIRYIHRLKHFLPISFIRYFHRIFGKTERHLLIGDHPNLCVFNLYRVGYYASLYKS